MGNIAFVVRAQKGVDLDVLTEALEEARMWRFCKLTSINALICEGDERLYSSLFGVELLYDPAKQGTDGYTIGGYKEKGEASIPREWRDLIQNITLLYPPDYGKNYVF